MVELTEADEFFRFPMAGCSRGLLDANRQQSLRHLPDDDRSAA